MRSLSTTMLLVLLLACSSRTTTGYAKVNGTTLYYERRGEGRAVVLIEGANMGLGQWDEVFDELAPRFDVLRYDVRGFGQSGRADSASFTAHDDLYALLRHLGIARASLVGLSLGGRIAIDFALAHPEMVDALVLAGPGLSGFSFTDDGSFAAIGAAAQRGDSLRAAELWLAHPYMAPAMRDPRLARRLRELAIANARAWVHPDSEKVAAQPAFDRLAEIRVPTLVIVGDRDVADIQHITDRIVQFVPGAQRVVFQNTGHVLHLEQPGRFTRAVIAFLDKHPAVAAESAAGPAPRR